MTAAAAQVNGVLAQVNAALGNLVTVKLLDQTKGVTSSNGYTHAVASLTGIHVGLAVPSLNLPLLAAGTAAAAPTSVGDIITSAGGSVPVVAGAMGLLNQRLGANALAGGATVDALQLSSSSDFAVGSTSVNPAAPTPASGTLAVTGGPTGSRSTFTGASTPSTTAAISAGRRRPGAYTTSAPAAR